MGNDAKRLALNVIIRLQDAGFIAVFAGGCVRDALLDIPPKDYDIATSATPDEVIEALKMRGMGDLKILEVGKSFGVIKVVRDKDVVEVATLRKDGNYSDGRRPDTVEYSKSLEEDARRRDFTINAMFVDPFAVRGNPKIGGKLIDFFGGQNDLEKGIIRPVGNAVSRFSEDYLRMLRAIRFAVRFESQIRPETQLIIQGLKQNLKKVSKERQMDELEKIMEYQSPNGLLLLHNTGLLYEMFPILPLSMERLVIFAGLRKSIPIDFAAILAFILQDSGDSDHVAGILRENKLPNTVIQRVSRILKVLELIEAKAHPYEIYKLTQKLVFLHDDLRWNDLPCSEGIARTYSKTSPFSTVMPYFFAEYRDPYREVRQMMFRFPVTFNPIVSGKLIIANKLDINPTRFGQLIEDAARAQFDGEFKTQREAIDWIHNSWMKDCG